jgi:hypothetical protein
MSELFGRGDKQGSGDLSNFDADRIEAGLKPLLQAANGSTWYESEGAPVDVATARLCMLRRARAAIGADPVAGDNAVRLVLTEADPDTVVWLLSRAISYMDEQGFPEFVPGARLE